MSSKDSKELDWRDAAGIVQFSDDMSPEKWVRGLRETRDEAIREVVDAAEEVVNNHDLTAVHRDKKLVRTSDLQRLVDALKAYWQKEGEEE